MSRCRDESHLHLEPGDDWRLSCDYMFRPYFERLSALGSGHVRCRGHLCFCRSHDKSISFGLRSRNGRRIRSGDREADHRPTIPLRTDMRNFIQKTRTAIDKIAELWSDRDIQIPAIRRAIRDLPQRSEEHTSELQSLMRISYAVFCLKKKKKEKTKIRNNRKNKVTNKKKDIIKYMI